MFIFIFRVQQSDTENRALQDKVDTLERTVRLVKKYRDKNGSKGKEREEGDGRGGEVGWRKREGEHFLIEEG